MKRRIKLFDPITGDQEKNAIVKVLKSNFWASGAGIGKVLEFEKKFNAYVGSTECIAVSNGTAALHLALSLIDIRNKEVILPSLSFVATAHAVIYNGGKPVFVDVENNTLCIDPIKAENAITKDTKIILPVHFAGMPSNLEKISKLCHDKGIFLIEDAAHAAGSTYHGKRIGSHGNAVCFSFHPVKNLAMPSGGAITLNGEKIKSFKRILQSKRWCGISNRKGSKYDVTELGWNYYMNEFSAAIGLEQLEKLDKMNVIRRKIAKRYSNEINLEHKMTFSNDCSYHFYWILVKNRDRFMKKMLENNVETGIHYKPIHQMKFYRKKDKVNLVNTENIGKHVVSLPTHPNLSQSDVSTIIKLVNQFS